MLPKIHPFLEAGFESGLRNRGSFSKTTDLTTQLNEKKLTCLEENHERKQVILKDKKICTKLATALE